MIKSFSSTSDANPSTRPLGQKQTAGSTRFVIEEITDPGEIARCRAQHERARRNTEWLEMHWPDFLPQARGKFLAVAGQQAFLADSPKAAWAWVDATHPDDDGAIVQYVRPQLGPRIYVKSWVSG